MGRIVLVLLTLVAPAARGQETPAHKRLAGQVEELREAIEKVNARHARKPGKTTEADLRGKLPKGHERILEGLLALPPGVPTWQLLRRYAEVIAELDLAPELSQVEEELRTRAPEEAARLGRYISRPRFLVHAVGVEDTYAEEFARALEGILKAYDRTFGFAEFSKVPGKKLRVKLHREAEPGAPHFAPEYPYHSTIDFPVGGETELTSPTADGRFIFYGLCHELGHLIAMWGDRRTEEDHHAWAHYTGVVIVEACADEKWASRLRDRRWRSLKLERDSLEETSPSRESRAGVLRLLVELHDLLGPLVLGQALNLMEEKGLGHRINHVRYYALDDLQNALLTLVRSRKGQARIKALFQ